METRVFFLGLVGAVEKIVLMLEISSILDVVWICMMPYAKCVLVFQVFISCIFPLLALRDVFLFLSCFDHFFFDHYFQDVHELTLCSKQPSKSNIDIDFLYVLVSRVWSFQNNVEWNSCLVGMIHQGIVHLMEMPALNVQVLGMHCFNTLPVKSRTFVLFPNLSDYCLAFLHVVDKLNVNIIQRPSAMLIQNFLSSVEMSLHGSC